MTNMTMQTAVVKACQLSSIIAVIAENYLLNVHSGNLISLAEEISGNLATFPLEKECEANTEQGGNNE
ncbi:hypothetical protein CGY19_11870 [Salmonella enterica]|nr:hypothetical protein [Salmonella enterica]